MLAGVKDLLGEDPLVSLHFPVVLGREGFGLLVPGPVADDPGEVPGAVAGAVVGDDPVEVGDAVRGEPHLGPG